jgi:hypothetical protein
MSVQRGSLDHHTAALGRRVERVTVKPNELVSLLRDVGDALRRSVPFAFDACWFTIDPSTLLVTGHYNAHLEADAELRRTVNLGLAVNEYQEPDVNKFAELATRRRPADTLHRATDGEPERSARYRKLLQPLGAAAELRAAFREGPSCWAGLALYRTAGEPDFSDAEIDLVLSVGAEIARGVREALVLGSLHDADSETTPGLVLFDEQGEVEATTPAAEHWLDQLIDPGPRRNRELPHVIYAVAARCREPGAGVAVRTRVPTRSGGWLVLHASLLNEGKRRRIAVILEPALPAEVIPLRMQAYRLTPREIEIADLVLQGRSTDEIAGALFIAPYTVQDHLKFIFGKSV